jgi:predicted transposase/invertase (TIGR01784 family)
VDFLLALYILGASANYIFYMEDSYLSNPHDKFFKESFSRKEVARSFVKEYIPEPIRKQLNFNTLTILKDSFIDKELSEHFSDILYRIKLSGKSCYIYLLFEHKSFIDPWTGFQLLRNMVKIWEQYLKQRKTPRMFPVILPIVIYQGKQKWEFKSSIGHLFEKIENTNGYIPEFKSEVFEISHIPDEKIKGEILLRVHFLIQKYSGTPEIFKKLPDILILLLSLSDKRTKTEYLEVLLRYLGATTDIDQIDDLKTVIEKTIENGGNKMPTIAEKWFQDGKTEGKTEGKIEGKIEVADKLMDIGMSDEQIIKATGLELNQIEELRKKKSRSA